MDKIIETITVNALNRYLDTLYKYGYKNYDSLDSLLVLGLYNKILTEEFNVYVNANDYKEILSALNCLYGSCMIDFPDFMTYDDIYRKTVREERYRKTEDDTELALNKSGLRISERNTIRQKAD